MSWDTVLFVMAIIFLLLGLVGSIIPLIPGPPLSFFGILFMQYSHFQPFSNTTLWIFGVFAVVITVLDYVVPIWGTKRFGGTKAGQWGSAIGVFCGFFILPPFGIIIGPFVGALVGEIIGGKDMDFAVKSAIGSFLGFLAGTGMKILYGLAAIVLFIIGLF